MSQIPQNIMKAHDPNDDPFASLSDDSSNQLQSPLEYGSGISFLVEKKVEDNEKEEHVTEPSASSTDEDKPVVEGSAVVDDKGADKEDDDKEE